MSVRGSKFLRLLFVFLPAALHAALTPTHLRCDWASDPLGVDSAPPHLSWQLTSPDAGARQLAYQIQAASSPALLAADHPDLWDTGRVESAAQLEIPYAGSPLATAQPVFWRVRTWETSSADPAWSPVANWTMGVVSAADWHAAWITDPALEAVTRQHLGFSTPPVADENTPEWFVLDLGSAQPIDQVVLYAVTHTVNERLGFPRWFRLEIANTPDFAHSTVIADTTAVPTNVWLTRLTLPAPAGTSGRFLRLTAPRLRTVDENNDGHPPARLALSQIVVLSAGRNIALHAPVTASASVEDDRWSAAALTDGLGLPGTNPRANSTLRLRHEFTVRPGLVRATLFVSGLGSYTLFANGARIAPDVFLTPGWTDYAKTVLYDTRDLTARLQPGPNALGLTLAGGMYNVPATPSRYTKFTGPPRALKAIAQLRLEYADGRIEEIDTDAAWRVAPGPVTYAHVYGGEDYDARLETPGWDRPGFDDSAWTPAAVTSGPGGTLRGLSHAAPSLALHETLVPVSVDRLRPGVFVYDLGQNTALIPILAVHGPAGATVKIKPAELLAADRSIDPRSTHGKGETSWNYTLAGDPRGESWQPRFFYHGARYLQVELAAPAGSPLPVIDRLDARVFSSTAAPVGQFATSSDLLNRIHTLVRWAQRSNLVSVLTDCPHRERLGWLEQYHLNGPSLRCEFDLTRLYAKTFGDMADAQLPNGFVPNLVPEYIRFDGDFRDSPEWGSSIILAPWQQYIWSGDRVSLKNHYAGMARYFAYLESRASGHILSHGLGDWYDLGPKPPGLAQLTPVPLVATAVFYQDAVALAAIARALDHPSDAARYEAAASDIASAFNQNFFDSAHASYATGSHTALAMPLALGLVPADRVDAVAAQLVASIHAAGDTANSGDVGFRYLLLALARTGHSDVVYDLATQTARPGYAWQLAHGATSLTEAWDANPHSSQNHFMLGQIVEWLYGRLAGLAPDPSAPGFARAIIAPEPVGGLAWAEASIDTVRGPFSVRWDNTATTFTLRVTVPPNATAEVRLPTFPGRTATESGRPVPAGPFEIPSGPHVFKIE